VEYSKNLSTITRAIYDLVEADKFNHGLEDVFYGDQALIPRTPAVAIEPGQKTASLNGPGIRGRVRNDFIVYLLVYVAKITDEQENRLGSEELAESIEALLHDNTKLDGLISHGYVTSIESGYVQRGNSLMRSARITWTGFNETMI
jgi:hypothetical protein